MLTATLSKIPEDPLEEQEGTPAIEPLLPVAQPRQKKSFETVLCVTTTVLFCIPIFVGVVLLVLSILYVTHVI
jgi:hypothetical protein